LRGSPRPGLPAPEYGPRVHGLKLSVIEKESELIGGIEGMAVPYTLSYELAVSS